MRTFDGNLNAYHALNTLVEIQSESFKRRLLQATTIEELKSIWKDQQAYFNEQSQKYEELGQEMVKIMSKKWWQFWKW